jgi:penicillin-binding protein 2
VAGVLLLSVMVVRLWYLQVLNTKSFHSTVVSEAYQVDQAPAPRGVIETRNGIPLVTNQAEEEITMSRADAQQHPQVVGAVAALVGQSAATIDADLANPQYTAYQQIPVAENASVTQLTTLGQDPGDFPGVKSQVLSVRSYPYGTTASHLLGYVTPITQAELKQYKNDGYQLGAQFGQSGLEAEYQQYLRGTPGKDLVEVNAQGNTIGVT